MREIGIVTDKDEKYIFVKVERTEACSGNCKECGSCKKQEHIVKAKNPDNAKIGDSVYVELKSGDILKAAFLVYILPLVLLIAGYYFTGIFTKNIIPRISIGLILMLACFPILHIYDKKNKEKYIPTAFLVN